MCRNGKDVAILRTAHGVCLLLCVGSTFRTEERTALCLNDSRDRCLAAGGTPLSLTIVDSVFVLIAAGIVKCRAVGTVGEG